MRPQVSHWTCVAPAFEHHFLVAQYYGSDTGVAQVLCAARVNE